MRTSYDTALKHLYRKGLEEAVPKSIRKAIPRSTIHRWRNEEDHKYVGCELNDLASSELELPKEFAKSKSAKRMFMAYVRIGRFIQSVLNEKVIREKFKEHKEDLIDLVERTRTTLSLEQVLKCFNLSKTTYNLWVLGLYSGCLKSKLDWCLVRQPHQLRESEVKQMRSFLTDKDYSHWPISSIAYYAQRSGRLVASASTWYKYSKLLGIERKRAPYKKKRYLKGIKAKVPNQIWHADVTYFKIGLQTYHI